MCARYNVIFRRTGLRPYERIYALSVGARINDDYSFLGTYTTCKYMRIYVCLCIVRNCRGFTARRFTSEYFQCGVSRGFDRRNFAVLDENARLAADGRGPTRVLPIENVHWPRPKPNCLSFDEPQKSNFNRPTSRRAALVCSTSSSRRCLLVGAMITRSDRLSSTVGAAHTLLRCRP